MLARICELICYLELHKLDIVLLQETWLNNSHTGIAIPNYSLVSRRDRSDRENRGSIATYVYNDCTCCSHLCEPEADERSRHVLHTSEGAVYLCNWYPPGSSSLESLSSFESDLK